MAFGTAACSDAVGHKSNAAGHKSTMSGHELRSQSIEVAGVTFVRVTAQLREQCQRTANAVGYPVPCPTLLPLGLTPTPTVHGCQFAIIATSGQRGICGVRHRIFGLTVAMRTSP
jgi:hypothetical protein